jgi:hypothetical protein
MRNVWPVTPLLIAVLLTGCSAGDEHSVEGGAHLARPPGDTGDTHTGGAMGGMGTGAPMTFGGLSMIVCVEAGDSAEVTSVETSPGSGIEVSRFAVMNEWPDEVAVAPGELADTGIDLSQRLVTQPCISAGTQVEYAAVVVELRRTVPDKAVSKYFVVNWRSGPNSGSLRFDTEQWICDSTTTCGPDA